MKNKMLLAAMLLLPLVLATALGASNVFAQGPVNTNPGSALYLDNQWHVIPPNTTLWYVFDLNNERLPVEIKLPDGLPKQLQFNVYPPDQIGFNSVGNPIGRGSAPSGSNDLQWKGVFYGGGTFFVELINPTTTAQPFVLGIAGGGVTLRVQPPAPTRLPPATPFVPPPPSPTINILQTIMFPAIATLRAPAAAATTATPSTPVTTTVQATLQSVIVVVVTATPLATPSPTQVSPPAPTAVPPPLNDWWTNSYYVVNGRTQTIPGNSERWFAFDYAGDRSKIEIRIPGGYEKKLIFRLFTLDQVVRYMVDGRPIGEGTAGLVPCDAGKCKSNDLVWAGDFSAGGTYFVQVTNFDPTPKNYEIVITGGGVTLGR